MDFTRQTLDYIAHMEQALLSKDDMTFNTAGGQGNLFPVQGDRRFHVADDWEMQSRYKDDLRFKMASEVESPSLSRFKMASITEDPRHTIWRELESRLQNKDDPGSKMARDIESQLHMKDDQ